MTEDILHGNVFVNQEGDIIDELAELTKACFSLARNGLISQEKREEFSKKAETLAIITQVLARKKFGDMSANIDNDVKNLKQQTTDVKKKIARLDQLVDNLETVNDILRLVDQGLAIAAGLAKTF